MADYRAEASIGARVRAARRERGFRTTRDFAESLSGTKITESVLENIESGRKADLTLGQFLSIAYALRVPPSYLLAPIVRPTALLDLQNISDELRQLSTAEFDAWFSGVSTGAHRPASTAERSDRDDLEAFREWSALRREIDRLHVVLEFEASDDGVDSPRPSKLTSERIEVLENRAGEIQRLLTTSGFKLDSDGVAEPQG
jgi:transcriptional regulator with XRE-family HTH domain